MTSFIYKMQQLNKVSKITPVLAKGFIDEIKEPHYTAYQDLFTDIRSGIDEGEMLEIVLSCDGVAFEERAKRLLRAYERTVADIVDGYVDDMLSEGE